MCTRRVPGGNRFCMRFCLWGEERAMQKEIDQTVSEQEGIGDTQELRSEEDVRQEWGDETDKPVRRRRIAKNVIVDTARTWDKRDVNRGIILALALVAVVIVSMLLTKISVLWNVLGSLFTAMTPVWIGLAFAYILNPLHNFMMRILKKPLSKKIKKESTVDTLANVIGLVLTILLFLGLIIGLLAILLPQLKDSLFSLYNNLPTYVNNVKEWLDGIFSNSPSIQETINKYLSNFENTMSTFFKDTLLPNMDTIIAKVSSGILDGVGILVKLFVGLIISIYILGQKKKLGAQSKKLLFSICSKKRGTQVLEATGYVNGVFGGFVNGKILDSLLIGALCFVFCSIVDMPYGVLVSAIIAVTNIIPFFGPIIGVVPAGILILVESPKMALVFVIFIIVLQQLDANLLQPVMLGGATGLTGLWVLFAITVGSGLFGVVGMILSVPVFAIIYTIFNIYLRHRLKHKSMTNQTEYYYDLIGFDDEGNPIRGEREKIKINKNKNEKHGGLLEKLKLIKKKQEKETPDPPKVDEAGFMKTPSEEERKKADTDSGVEKVIVDAEEETGSNKVKAYGAKRVDGKKNRQNRPVNRK